MKLKLKLLCDSPPFECPFQLYDCLCENRTGSMDESLFDHPALDDNVFLAFMLELMPEAARGKWLKGLANYLVGRWEKRGSADDLDRAIDLLEKALVTFPIVSGEYAWCLEGLGEVLTMRFRTKGSLDDLNRVLELNENALASIPVSNSNYPLYLDNVSTVLLSRFQATGSTDDLNQAISMAQRAVTMTPQNNDLGSAKHTAISNNAELEKLRSITTLDQIFESLSRAIPESRPDRSKYLIRLSSTLQRRFEKEGSIDDLNQAIIAAEQAVASTTTDHPRHVLYLNYLCQTIRNRFELQGGIADLNQAIAIREQAVTLTHEI